MPFTTQYLTCAVMLTAIVVLIHLSLPKLLAWRGVHFYRHTRSGMALVFDSEDDDKTPVRLLNVGGVYQSVAYVEPQLQDELVCEYHRSFAAALQKLEKLERVLVIGGGGMSFPRWLLAHSSCHVVVAEIDPKIVDIAREHLYLDRIEREHGPAGTGRFELKIADGWQLLCDAADTSFDAIVNDAFARNVPIGELSNEQGAQLVYRKLRPEGIYVANLRFPLEGPKASAMQRTVDAYTKVFGGAELIPEVPEQPKRLGNNVLVSATKSA